MEKPLTGTLVPAIPTPLTACYTTWVKCLCSCTVNWSWTPLSNHNDKKGEITFFFPLHSDHFPILVERTEEQTSAKQCRSRKGKCLSSSCHQISNFGKNPKQPPPPSFCGDSHVALSPASQSLSPSLLHNSPVPSFSWTDTFCVCVWHLIINWITLLIPDRSNFYTDLFSDSCYSMDLQATGSANPVGSNEQPRRTTENSFATKSLHNVEAPITKQLYAHSKPTHVKNPIRQGTSTLSLPAGSSWHQHQSTVCPSGDLKQSCWKLTQKTKFLAFQWYPVLHLIGSNCETAALSRRVP